MRVSYQELTAKFEQVLSKRVPDQNIVKQCAREFADTTAYGVMSHGVNRFPVFVGAMDRGEVKPIVDPVKVSSMGPCMELWDAKYGIGNLTAKRMMDHACDMAEDKGVGVVALRHANHWMRGGSYGYQAAKRGFIGICWTNSTAVMPAWGTKECCLGTNPLSIGVPSDPITLVDSSMSMFSYGKLQLYRLAGKTLPIDGGFDDEGNLCRDPGTLEKNKRILPMGYWKGSGLSIIFDMILVAMSGGLGVPEVTKQGVETGISQIFIAFKPLLQGDELKERMSAISDFVLQAQKAEGFDSVHIPGHKLEERYAKTIAEGVEVSEEIWGKIQQL